MGGGKKDIRGIHGEGESYDEMEGCNSYAFVGVVVKINLTQQDGITVYKMDC